uniref:SH3 domain-containing protein n=1 Tax=Caenorhabditis japonica TaxID=281687 RepID=A0A8R1E6L1_CAEJA
MKEEEIVDIANTTQSSADIFTALSQLPASVTQVEKVIEYMGSFEFTITDHLIAELRKKHQAVLMADQGMIVNTSTDTNLPKQTTQRRKLTRSKSIIKQIFSSKDDPASDPKSKNIRQTEILVDLKESVLQICRYFISCDEKMELNVCTQADYSPESHNKDIANYLKGRRVGAKRARALLDFAREEENELGFRKNDIITIISEKDEHCWVGEVNGLRGWFPAKFVEVVDERGKSYTIYGDEAVSPEITEYIRGRLANSFRQIMDHGIRESVLHTAMAYHPWSFIEDIAYYSVEKNFNSVYSRLTLCNTFNLDEDGKRGLGSAEIARRLQISSSTVRNVVAAIKKRGDASEVKKSGRPRSVNTRNTRAIIKKRIIRNDGLSLNRMASQLGIARSTIQSIVKNDLKLKSYKLRRGQYLSDKSKAMRLEKCRKLLQHFQVRRVSDVIWTDEKIFTIEPLPNRQNQRQLLSKDDSMSPKRRLAHNRLFPKSVMVWAGITATGKTPLVFIERNVKINSEVYQKIVLMDNLLPWVTQHFAGGPFILQQDWAPSHGSRSTLAVLEAHFPGFLDKNLWPASSPDLNPMDFSVWGMLEGKIAGKVFATVDDLKAALEVAWASIDDGYLRRTVNSILTPDELLFRFVQMINDSHNAVSAHSDVKLRSLLVVGVNEQCLHLWFDLLCSATQHEHIRNKYYHSWAFIRSPAWRQIKCDLRLLSQFSFNLSMSFEIDGIDKKKRKFVNGLLTSQKKKILSTVVSSSQDNKLSGDEPLKQGVTDMLIKHHLFSWDL